jgi:hypothetical protein
MSPPFARSGAMMGLPGPWIGTDRLSAGNAVLERKS